jgi:hypothetical protein
MHSGNQMGDARQVTGIEFKAISRLSPEYLSDGGGQRHHHGSNQGIDRGPGIFKSVV